jgi:hypothetical protein
MVGLNDRGFSVVREFFGVGKRRECGAGAEDVGGGFDYAVGGV